MFLRVSVYIILIRSVYLPLHRTQNSHPGLIYEELLSPNLILDFWGFWRRNSFRFREDPEKWPQIWEVACNAQEDWWGRRLARLHLSSKKFYSWEHINVLLRMLNKVFWKNSLQTFVALILRLLLVPFESKLVKFLTRNQSLKTYRKSMVYIAFEANRKKIHISAIFKNSLRLWLLANFYTKGTKRSVNVGATNLSTKFFKNILLNVNSKPAKIRSVHTYEVPWIHWCILNCIWN